MKVRGGLASNSSSSCYILNYRDERVKRLINLCTALYPSSLARHSAMVVGEAAVDYAEDWIEQTSDWYDEDDYTIARMIETTVHRLC